MICAKCHVEIFESPTGYRSTARPYLTFCNLDDDSEQHYPEPEAQPASQEPRFCICPTINPRQIVDGDCLICGLPPKPEAASPGTEMPLDLTLAALKKMSREELEQTALILYHLKEMWAKSAKSHEVVRLMEENLLLKSPAAPTFQGVPGERLKELAERLVAPGQFPNMSASEGYELYYEIQELLQPSALQGVLLTQADQKSFNTFEELWAAYLEQQGQIVDLKLALQIGRVNDRT